MTDTPGGDFISGVGAAAAELMQRLNDAAMRYIARTDRMVIHTSDAAYVRELAMLIPDEDMWSSFHAVCLNLATPNAATPPVMRAALTPLKEDLKILKRAIKTIWEAAERRRQSELVTDPLSSIDSLVDSESPYLVCIGLLLQHRRGRLWFDSFRNKIILDWCGDGTDHVVAPFTLTDDVVLKIMTWLVARNTDILSHCNKGIVTDAISYVANLDRRDSLVDHVNGLPEWDNVERLSTWVQRGFGCLVDEEVGQTEVYMAAVGKNFAVSLVARAYDPGCKVDTMPVLIGEQGAQKSSALEVLGGAFYREISESPNSKDFYVQIQGVWVGDMSELDAISSRKVEVTKVKAVLSRRVDNFRKHYGRETSDFPRRIVFCASGNQARWMRDETGNRRYWALITGAVDLEWMKANRDQLFAEARHLYRDGATWWEFPAEAHKLTVQAHQQVSMYEETVKTGLRSAALFDGTLRGPVLSPPDETVEDFTNDARWGNVVTPLRIAVQWLRIPFENAGRFQGEIVSILTRSGWENKAQKVPAEVRRVRDCVSVIWLWKPKDLAARSARRDLTVGEGGLTNNPARQSDIPF